MGTISVASAPMRTQRLFLAPTLLIILCLTLLLLLSFGSINEQWRLQTCFVQQKRSNDFVKSLPRELLPFSREEIGSKSIFFIETNSKTREFQARFNCAFESAALRNPGHSVFVLINSKSVVLPEHLGYLPNLRFRSIEPEQIVNNSSHSVRTFWQSGKLHRSRFTLNNVGNLIRLLLLHEYGGIYLDQDVITLRSLPEQDFVVLEDEQHLNNAILGFVERNHPFLEKTIQTFVEDYKGHVWGHQGPKLLDRVMKKSCDLENLQVKENLQCENVFLLNANNAYAIGYVDWDHLFRGDKFELVMKKLEKSFASHYWNHLVDKKTLLNSDSPLYRLFQLHCPVTEYFQLRSLVGKKFKQ